MKIRQVVSFGLLALAAGCSGGMEDDTSEDALTSITARSRTLKFAGYVYVDSSASDWTILERVKDQTQSAFGALRTSDIGVNSRELGNVDARTFVKSNVKVLDPANPTAAAKTMVKVSYTYTDAALVPKTMAYRSSVQLGLLNGSYQSQSKRILTECTNGDQHAQEFQGSIWYVFEPSLSQCKTAMSKEQATIDADKRKLTDATAIPLSEVNRLYIPMTAALTPAKTATYGTYPEYDRLWAGGVQKDKLVIGMVNGMMADWAAGETHADIDDDGYRMWFEGIREMQKVRPLKVTKTEPAVDLTTVVVSGVTVKVPGGFDDILKMELDGTNFPTGYTDSTKKRALRVEIGKKLVRNWVTFEAPVSVSIGGATPRNVTIVLQTYFGAETSSTPHKRAIKTSDIFVYNGHSYIGYGPLDPSNFYASDFPSSYQIMFINGCVSYNYYEKDYVPLKPGGTANLELVTNGLESWVNGSGPAMGRFIGAIIDGKQNSYYTILKAAQFTGYGYEWGQDALRVVDGEVDNKYKPLVTKITVTNR